PALKFTEAISAKRQLAHWTARLQHIERVGESATVVVDLVGKRASQNFTGVIEPLLRVAHSIKQFAAKNTRAAVEMTAKIDHVLYDKLGGRAGRWRAQVGDEIANGEIDLVADRGNDRHIHAGDRTGDNFFIELPQVFHASAAAGDDDEIDRR